MSRIANDILDMMGQRALADSRRAMNTALERLATGKRINRASDDPAGLVASTNLSIEAKRAEREMKSLEINNRRLDASEGGLGVVSDLLVSLQSVVVEAANTGAKDGAEREALRTQASSIIEALNHVSTSTFYDGEQILQAYHAGALGGMSASIRPARAPAGADDPQLGEESESPEIEPTAVSVADLAQGRVLNLVDGDLEIAQKVVQGAIDSVARSRAVIGSQANSNRSRINALFAEFENTMAAKSAIEDTDFARETSEFVRTKILGEASIRSILIGRTQATSVLNLL